MPHRSKTMFLKEEVNGTEVFLLKEFLVFYICSWESFFIGSETGQMNGNVLFKQVKTLFCLFFLSSSSFFCSNERASIDIKTTPRLSAKRQFPQWTKLWHSAWMIIVSITTLRISIEYSKTGCKTGCYFLGMMGVVMLSVVMLRVVAPLKHDCLQQNVTEF